MSELPSVSNGLVNDPAVVRWFGIGALLLIFFAAAIGTSAYLSDTQVSAAAQTATVANSFHDPFGSVSLEADSAYVLDLTNNQVLYQKNPNAQLPLASITKVPLALVVAEAMPPDSQITIPFDTAPQGNAQRLAKGDTWKVQDVIDFTLVASSNEGAQILADAANSAVLQKYPEAPHGGVDSAVLWRMNNLAKNLSLSRTYFINVNGLDVSTTEAGAYGSAYDIAELFAYAAEHSPAVFAATTHDSLQLQSIGGQETSAINTDKALDAIPGILMGKTGYTDLAGGNLAVVFSVAPNHPVVAVVLHSSVNGRFDDIKKLVQATQAAILNR